MADAPRVTAQGSRWITVSPTADGKEELTISILLHCPLCDPTKAIRVTIPGHHARMLRDACIEAIDKYPELCQEEVTMEPLQRVVVPPDPSRN